MAPTGALAALVSLFLAAVLPDAAVAYRVLGVLPHIMHSHNVMFKPLFEELAARGHEVFMISPFPQKTKIANYTDLDVSSIVPPQANTMEFDFMAKPGQLGSVATMRVLANLADADTCRRVFSSKHFQDVMKGAYGKFDVVFTEVSNTDCWAAVPYKLKVPMISLSTQPGFMWSAGRVGYPDNPAYITTSFMNFAYPATFWQRLYNTYNYLTVHFLAKRWLQDSCDDVVREFFGADTPPLSELVQRTSLVMENVWPGVQLARPVPPNVLQVGGLHIRPPRLPGGATLEPGLRAWMDAAEHGVIFFTMGSGVRTSTLPKDKFLALRDAFAALPQRVLWKYELDTMEGQPDNVRIASWFPAIDVLSHPKTVLFITHGGLMGTLEAVYAGVPMLGIPLVSDQGPNVELYKHRGIAERLDHWALTKDRLLELVNKMIKDPKYRERAREVSALYRDRPRTPAQEAVWWTEYVVRHRGAPHLRPVGADMPLHQYLLLDVAAVVLAAVVVVLLAARAVVRRLASALTSKPPSPSSKTKRKGD
ncbi:hypothetical protein ONE63_003553 [Megalurothrips usitatus]|uniref:Glucuronosyltransferase n=1 Tax=Megalurothrips usitatus TaxID=439358 RepID=A0AAV7X458_9NEOP|nr:hypothetical protein ONE63_003553 [Megalurothrips usitatus]